MLLLCELAFGAEVRITTPQGLIDFSNNVNNGATYSGTTVFLSSDIDLSGQTLETIGKTTSNYFLGVFDAQGYIISNLAMKSSLQYMGLFGYSRGLTIKNVILHYTCSIVNSLTTPYYTYMGGIIGYCETDNSQCLIENSVNVGSLTFNGDLNNVDIHIGGIAGQLKYSQTYDSIIRNCVNYGPITDTGRYQADHIGGILGAGVTGTQKICYIQNCANYGTIIINSQSTYSSPHYHRIGGIVGEALSISINNCLSGGIINLPDKTIGLIGTILGAADDSSSSIAHSYWTSDVGYDAIYGSVATGSAIFISETSLASLDATTVTNLNSYATSNGWSKWLFNPSGSPIIFKINNNQGLTVSRKVILLPTTSETSSNKFSGWYKDANYNQLFQSTSVTAATTLYELYKIVSTATFNSNGGSTPSPATKTVVYSDTYGTLATTTRTGYTFAGWFTAASGGTEIKSTTKVVTTVNQALYAHWTANAYTVTFDENGGNTPSKTSMSVTYDSTYGDLASVERIGYSFNGWFTAENGGTEIKSTTKVTAVSDHTLYARWTINSYNLTFDFNNGTALEVRKVEYNNKISYPSTPTKEGHSFNGWDKQVITMPAEDVTIKAQWTINNYKLGFIYCDGSFTAFGYDYNEEVEYPKDTERAGYTFKQWDKTITKMPAEHVNVTAQCDINSYNARFVFGNGDEDEVKSFKYKEAVKYPEEPVKEGYTFSGWDKEISTMPAENVTLYAKWNINQYNLTFIFNNGAENEVRTLDFNSEIVYPENVEKTGYTFNGWDNKPDKMPAESLIITAQWIANQYNVTFDVNGGNVLSESESKKEVTYDSPYGDLPEVTRTGYTFVGWYTEESSGTNTTAEDIVKITVNQTLYAQWTANVYIVSFEGNEGTSSQQTKDVTYDEEYGDLPEATRTGYTFTGWFTEKEGREKIKSEDIVNITANQTFYARWTANVYAVTFDVNGGNTLSESESKKEVTYDSIYGDLPEATRIGFIFDGWFTDKAFTNEITSESPMSTPNDHTLYAKWNAEGYLLIFIFGNGTDPEERSLNYNDPIAYPAEPVKEGHTFNGWSETIESMPANDLTITALWSINNYTLTFDFNNGNEAKEMMLEFGKEIPYPAEPVKEGHTFNGWSETIEFMPARNLIITAQWSINNYTLRFDLNNGGDYVIEEVHPFNDSIEYPKEFVKEGHTFDKWDSNITFMPAHDLTITALWSVNEYRLMLNFVNGSEPEVRHIAFNDLIEYPESVEKEGHTFNGWDSDLERMPSYDLTATLSGCPRTTSQPQRNGLSTATPSPSSLTMGTMLR